MQGKNGASVSAAAALFVCVAALLPVVAGRAHAHGSAPVSVNSDTATAAPAVNRWGANYFPNAALTTQDGKTVRLYDDLLKGKTVAINVIFTECQDVCPLETAMMVQLKRALGDRVGKDIFFYSISIDPERDTPEVLKAYAEKFGAGGPGWLFLTGKADEIKVIARKLGLSRSRNAPTRDGHSSILMVGNEPTGQWQKHSALDNPRFLASRISSFMGWKESEPAQNYAEARPVTPEEEQQYLFQSKCGACHTIGQGDKVGPDLSGVTAQRERAWLTRYIQAPDEVLAAGDPVAAGLFKKYKGVRMPNLGLKPEEVTHLLSYLETQSAAQIKKAHTHTH
jgi:protein SCO1/2